MQKRRRSPHIYTPESLVDLLSLYHSVHDSLLYAGGTYIMRNQTEKVPILPQSVISLQSVEELSRISRTERYMEIGATVPLNRILSIGRHVLPPLLFSALAGISSYPVRNLATIGGNICVRERRMTSFPALCILDAQLELKKHTHSRWVPMGRFADSAGSLDLEAGEIATRIRIPFDDWDFSAYKRSGIKSLDEGDTIDFCVLAKLQKDSIQDFRFAFNTLGNRIIRNREIENLIIGRKYPFSERDEESLLEGFERQVLEKETTLSLFQKARAKVLFSWALRNMPEL